MQAKEKTEPSEEKHEAGPVEKEIPVCHLHKKNNKACKYCKARNKHLERVKSREADQEAAKRAAALEAEKKNLISGLDPTKSNDKVPLPNFPGCFPQVLRDKTEEMRTRFFRGYKG